MNLKEFLSALDMESPADLKYFEQFAELLECEEPVPYDFFYTALSQADAERLSDITKNYMDELTGALPDSEAELFTIIDAVQHKLLLLCKDLDAGDNRREYAEELYRFREWLRDPHLARCGGVPCSVLDAVAELRCEKLGAGKADCDFTNALNYRLPDLTMPLGGFSAIDVLDETEA